LLEGLRDITKAKGLSNFELVLRISSEQNGEKWDSDFVRRQMEVREKENLKKVFVCGPPAMNELFDRTF
jgi:predicted ferric reductase